MSVHAQLGFPLGLSVLNLSFDLLDQLGLQWVRATNWLHLNAAISMDESGHIIVDKDHGNLLGKVAAPDRNVAVAQFGYLGSVALERVGFDVAGKQCRLQFAIRRVLEGG